MKPYDLPSGWSLVWADGTPMEATRSVARQVAKASAVLELLLIEQQDENRRCLGHAGISTVPGDLAATMERVFDRAHRLIGRAREIGEKALVDLSCPAIAGDKPVTALLRLQLRYRRVLDRLKRIILHENWMIGWIDAPIADCLEWRECPPVTWLEARSARRYLADPFAWPGRPDIILCEEYDFATRLGTIRRLQIGNNGISIETPVDFGFFNHLSFPFLFAHDGEAYCLPESSGDGRLVLFLWHEETDTWREFATPLIGRAADSILFLHGDLFWIAYTDLAIDPFDNLNLLYAESLAGPWMPHRGNPVKLDPRSSRCAGSTFAAKGALYRPAQDCASGYGSAIRIMKIAECSPALYREEEITRIRPENEQNPDGFHTLTAWGETRCLIDGKRMEVSAKQIADKLMRRLGLI